MKLFRIVGLLLISSLIMPMPAMLAQQKRTGSGKEANRAAKPELHGNVEAIKASILRDYLYFVASDEMEGRDTPSRGLNTTAKFIAMHLSRWGVKPAGDNGSYFQNIGLKRTIVDSSETFLELNGTRFHYGEDVLRISGNSTAAVSGPLVFVGNGWMVKSKKIDSYQGIDIKDKIVVYTGSGFPKGVNYSDLDGKQGEDWDAPAGYAQRHGAKGIIMIPDFQMLSNWEEIRAEQEEKGSVSVEKFNEQENAGIPGLVVSVKLANQLFQGERLPVRSVFEVEAGKQLAPFELQSDKKVRVAIASKNEPARTQNVIGIVEGSDPVLKNEYVAIGAHYDHVGIDTPVNGDAIYNGADDDGSGTVSVLALAEAFATGAHPKRSVLFVWHCGEEKGLWGSQYLMQFPVVPLDQIVAQLNIDMIGRTKIEGVTAETERNRYLSGPNEVYVIGSKLMSTELGELSEEVNRNYLNLNFNYRFDDPRDPFHYFARSDHFNYALKGIPIIFYFDGAHEDYHRPSDSADKIDYEKMEKIVRTIYLLGWELGNRAKRPTVDKQIPAEMVN